MKNKRLLAGMLAFVMIVSMLGLYLSSLGFRDLDTLEDLSDLKGGQTNEIDPALLEEAFGGMDYHEVELGEGVSLISLTGEIGEIEYAGIDEDKILIVKDSSLYSLDKNTFQISLLYRLEGLKRIIKATRELVIYESLYDDVVVLYQGQGYSISPSRVMGSLSRIFVREDQGSLLYVYRDSGISRLIEVDLVGGSFRDYHTFPRNTVIADFVEIDDTVYYIGYIFPVMVDVELEESYHGGNFLGSLGMIRDGVREIIPVDIPEIEIMTEFDVGGNIILLHSVDRSNGQGKTYLLQDELEELNYNGISIWPYYISPAGEILGIESIIETRWSLDMKIDLFYHNIQTGEYKRLTQGDEDEVRQDLAPVLFEGGSRFVYERFKGYARTEELGFTEVYDLMMGDLVDDIERVLIKGASSIRIIGFLGEGKLLIYANIDHIQGDQLYLVNF